MPKSVKKSRGRKPKVSPTPYEVGRAAGATAIRGLVQGSLESLRLLHDVSQKRQGSLVASVAGLCLLDEHPTACAMAATLGISHDRLTRLCGGLRFPACAVATGLIALVQSLGHAGWLILDDGLVPHRRGKTMAGVSWDYDHAERKTLLGMRLVVVLWTAGLVRIPLAFAVWHKQGVGPRQSRRKKTLARLLVRLVIRKGSKPLSRVFDAWDASKQHVRLFHRLGVIWVTRLKQNCRLRWQGKKLLAQTIGRRLLKAKRPSTFHELAGQGRSAAVAWGSLTGLTFVVVKDDLDEETKPLLQSRLSNDATCQSARPLSARQKSRWAIEVFFRDAKQHLGLGASQGRSLPGAICHISVVCVAAVVLDWIKGPGMTLGDAKRTAQRLMVIQDEHGRAWLAVQTVPDWSEPTLLEQAKLVVEPHLSAVCHLRLPKLKYPKAA